MSADPTYEALAQQVKELTRQNEALQRKYHAVVDHSMDAILLTMPDGRVVFANPAACDLFQMTEQEIIAGGRDAVVDPEDPNLAAALEVRARTGQFIGELRLKKKDGTIFPGEVSSSLFMDDDGRTLTSMIIRDLTERQQIEESLRIYQNIVSSTPDGFAFLDKDYRYVVVNDAYEQYSEVAPQQFIGRTVAEYLGEEVFQRQIKSHFDRCMHGEVVTFQGWFDYPARGRKFVDVSYYPYRDNDNRIAGVIANTSDITERKLTQDALTQSRERRKQVIENSNAGYFFIDRHGQFQEVNSAWLNMHKYAHADEVVGRHFTLTQVDQDLQEAHKIVERLLSKEEVVTGEYSRRCKDNSVGYHAYTARPVKEQGEVIGLEGFLIDITERRKAQEALLKSKERYRLMFENMMDGFALHQIVTDHKGEPIDYIFLEVNSAFERLTGLKRDDIVGKKVTEVLPGIERDPSDWIGRYGTVALTGKKCRFEQHAQNLDKWYSVLAYCPKRGQFATIFEDVTDYQIALKEKKRVQAQLQQAQKMESIGNLAGGIAHDFNNILSSILGFTELALEDIQPGSAAADSLQEVYAAAKRARDLVRQILAFARQSDEEVKPIRVDGIIDEVLKFIRSSIPATIAIKTRLHSASLIMGNNTQVHQMLMNLCTNAAQAMEDDGGVLEVSLDDITIGDAAMSYTGLQPGKYIQMNVSDTGLGIPEEHLDAVFEPYFTTKGQAEGTGLGLAVVHGIIESYGGKIQVESKLGQGTVFTIYLPVTQKCNIHQSYTPEDLPCGTEHILFVEDEAPIANMGRRILERLGYSVTARTSSIEALELFSSKPDDFDLVITDMTMPNITGDRLAVKMMEIRADIPVILCTGYSKRISEEAAGQIGIKAFLYKPVTKADLAKTIRKVLKGGMG
jgi:PAS domain S-box-containing protein